MEQYINKADVVAEIERIKKEECPTDLYEGICKLFWFEQFLTFINDLEVKEVDNKNDNPKPKFKVGNWITFYGGIPFKILKIEEELNGILDYLLVCQDGYASYYNKKYVDENARLWSIQDAKPGDVLVCPKYAGDTIPNIFIFKDIKIKDNDVFCYCSFLETFRTGGYIANADPINTDFYPATKEQCDTLERAITNAGYTFDFEKKELKITNFSKHLKYNPDAPSIIEQKPKWSEEDECYMAECINAIATKDGWSFEDKRKTKHWLKSIKERII